MELWLIIILTIVGWFLCGGIGGIITKKLDFRAVSYEVYSSDYTMERGERDENLFALSGPIYLIGVIFTLIFRLIK